MMVSLLKMTQRTDQWSRASGTDMILRCKLKNSLFREARNGESRKLFRESNS